MNWKDEVTGFGIAMAIFFGVILLLNSIKISDSTTNAKARVNHPRSACEWILTKMPTTADSVDAMTLITDCAYTHDSLLPLVRGDALRDLPEQR